MPESPVISPPPRRSVRIPSADEVLIVIDRILRYEVGLDFAVQPSTMFHEELALDSLGTFSLIVALEDHFKVTLPDQFADEVRTISDLATLVVRQAELGQAEVT